MCSTPESMTTTGTYQVGAGMERRCLGHCQRRRRFHQAKFQASCEAFECSFISQTVLTHSAGLGINWRFQAGLNFPGTLLSEACSLFLDRSFSLDGSLQGPGRGTKRYSQDSPSYSAPLSPKLPKNDRHPLEGEQSISSPAWLFVMNVKQNGLMQRSDEDTW